MKHVFHKGTNDKTIILLHGTGGDEHDLIPLGKALDQNANLLGIRGNLNEQGMNRFFRRFAIGKFDLENFKSESINLYNTINELRETYHIDLSQTTIVGFSNGANIIEGLLQYTNIKVKNYALISPAYINPSDDFKVKDAHIFIATSSNDPYVSDEMIAKLKEDLKQSTKNLTIFSHERGHQLTSDVFQALYTWFNA